MNYAAILAGGVGQRMRSSGRPKQFLEVFRKPIIIYTLEKFEHCQDIDQIVIACNSGWMDYMNSLIEKYGIKKVVGVVSGGKDRQSSIKNCLSFITQNGGCEKDILVIHDGVRPLIEEYIITENIRMAQKYGSAMTVKPVVESVVVTDHEEVGFSDFKKRDDTYSLTAPQTFRLGILEKIFRECDGAEAPIPLLDAALVYTYLGNQIPIIKDNGPNIKITTPEDYYILKAILELEESKYVFGL